MYLPSLALETILSLGHHFCVSHPTSGLRRLEEIYPEMEGPSDPRGKDDKTSWAYLEPSHKSTRLSISNTQIPLQIPSAAYPTTCHTRSETTNKQAQVQPPII